MMAKNILLIDDDPSVRDTICYVLQNAGYAVTCTAIFEDLNEIAAHHPDLILIDKWVSKELGIAYA